MAGDWEEILRRVTGGVGKMDANVVEANLAITRAALSAWKEWVEAVSDYTNETASGLVEISRDPSRMEGVVGKLTDANREYFRRITELPQNAVRRYQEELREMQQSRKPAQGNSQETKPKRRARAKA